MNCIFYRPLEEVIRIHEEKQVQFSQSLPVHPYVLLNLMPRCSGFSRKLFH